MYFLLLYIPLTNLVFSVRAVRYGRSFSLRFMARAYRAWAINRRGKKTPSVTYSTDLEDEVSKKFIISLLCV